jgi:hypothetical protein
MRFPLPAGEGKGEGERDAANQNGRKNFASSTPPVPRLKVELSGSIRRVDPLELGREMSFSNTFGVRDISGSLKPLQARLV